MTSKTKSKNGINKSILEKRNKQYFLERQQSRKLQRKRALYADNPKKLSFNRNKIDTFISYFI